MYLPSILFRNKVLPAIFPAAEHEPFACPSSHAEARVPPLGFRIVVE
jgi:hypothetical protein